MHEYEDRDMKHIEAQGKIIITIYRFYRMKFYKWRNK